MMKKWLLQGVQLIAMTMIFIIVPSYAADVGGRVQQFSISVDDAYDVSGQGDISLMQRYFQGASWELPIPSETWQKLKPLGVSRVRLINVESGGEVAVDSRTGGLTFNFSNLLPAIRDCKKYGLKPHIIVGQNAQRALAQSSGKFLFGVRDWNAYEAYAYALLKFVTVEQGVTQVDFEVANEPDTNGASWLLPEARPPGVQQMFDAYITLYEAWSSAAQKLSRAYPNVMLRLGGPAAGPYTFLAGDYNWYSKFAHEVSRRKLLLNFCSFHFYGNEAPLSDGENFGSFPPFPKMIRYIREEFKRTLGKVVPIYITEWGASNAVNDRVKGVVNGNHAGAAWAARFVLNSAELGVDAAMALVLRDHTFKPGGDDNWSWPAFLLADGVTEKALYKVALMFMRLPMARIRVIGDQGDLRVIAAKGERKLAIMVINDVDAEKRSGTICIKLVGKKLLGVLQSRISRFLVDESHGDAYAIKLRGGRVSEMKPGLEMVNEYRVAVVGGGMELPEIKLSPSSVMFLEIDLEK